MAALTVRHLPEEVHRALRVRAARNGHSTEAEVRSILTAAVVPQHRIMLGDALVLLGRQLQITDGDIDTLNAVRDHAPATPWEFA
ncbi:MAG: toxin-antitoxin system antitoxin subunit [Micrococcales bacterium]|nr:toxin-antitoxin system antitoxin subunit [Micrococcales bacterium]